jgi:ribosomal protein S18 acetylase RimI-like enzyme
MNVEPVEGPTLGEFRDELTGSDIGEIRRIVSGSGLFRASEVEVAVELAVERLARGGASGYHFVLSDDVREDRVGGYACYGPIPCTVARFDLHWIAVDAALRGLGLGRRLLSEGERRVVVAGGRRLYVETSSLPCYVPTRRFYEACGYVLDSVVRDYYDDGDDMLVYRRTLVAPSA